MCEETPFYCRGCRYEVSGIEPDRDGYAQCPECGRSFQPDSPRTMSRSDRHPVSRFVLNRFAAYIVFGLILGYAWIQTWVPRPAVDETGAFSFSLWVWFDRPIGVERVAKSGGDPWSREVRVTWRFGRMTGASMWGINDDETEALHWRLVRPDRTDDAWSFTIDDPLRSNWRDVIFYFNSMRSDDELFGVRIGSTSDAVDPTPIQLEGTQLDVMSLLIRLYEIEIEPVERPDRDWVWTWNAETETLERVKESTIEELLPFRDFGPPARHAW